ncbi:hypothetical protein CERSUDRAFT_110794 [Gelatoporia subvermispora B]|uniref:Utp14-domain-containing protein n=1 Tax=Ceriporiopsis subvermispora (strain B) TaxID=914234 RepID=M2QYM1_CERS8|nr:hypothetical protein CERSUDRAFT_110794 [Gelatoporia subvermispora B]
MPKPKKQSRGPGARTPTRKTANTLGYARRQTLKSKALSKSGVPDVYEYEQEKVRRSKVKLQVDRDELLGMAPGSEDEDEDEDEGAPRRGKAARPRLVGEKDDDDRIDEDEDEEIDSDEAFEESDEERFAGFNFSHSKTSTSGAKSKQSKKRPLEVRQPEIDLNEDEDDEDVEMDSHRDAGSDEEEEEEEGDASDFFDVLDIMDGRGPPPEDADANESGGKTEQRSERKNGPDAAETHATAEGDDKSEFTGDEEHDSESEESEGESDEAISASDVEEDENADALEHLQNFVTTLDAGQKRKVSEVDAEDTEALRPRKRRVLKEKTEAGVENEFAALTGGGKLNLDDLLAPLAGQSSNLLSLKKSTKVLASSSGSAKTLSAPLPQRTAERLDREAAYEQTKEEVDKWKATMQRIREAEHLSFPLQAQPSGKTSNLELAAKFKPSTELENAVDKLLKSAKMREEDIAQTEALKMNHLSVEEVAARRAELAKMRELMFRAEAKAKRVAKIKSKTYRRLKKKEKAKLAAQLGQDEDAEDDDDEEVRMKREIERARERATLRHKNTGKWAKAMKARGELDEDQRQDIHEMLDRGEKLRRKIRGEGESDEEDSGDESDDDDEGAEQRIKASAFKELVGLDDEGSLPAHGGKKGKSIFEMKFMQDAMAKQQRQVNEMVDDFVKEMGSAMPEEGAEGTEVEVQQHSYGTVVERVGGRAVYRPGAAPSNLRTLDSLASDTSSVTLKSTDFPPEPQVESPQAESSVVQRHTALPTAEAPNPWLALHSDEPGKAAQKKHEIVVSKTSTALEKSKNKLRKQTKKRADEKEKAKDDAIVDISMADVMTLGTTASTPAGSSKVTASAPSTSKAASQALRSRDDDDDSDVNSEVEEQEKVLHRKGKGKGKANGAAAFEQRDLVALAFAGDNVVRDFVEEKRREMQEDAPHEVDTTLPGWGSWGGRGTKKAPPKPHLIKKVAGIDPTSRADYKKAHVIISEKRDKKASKYQVKDLPYPYTSKAQFERSMEMPIGTEWNTRLGFQRATLPKVIKKMGTVISPLEKLL